MRHHRLLHLGAVAVLITTLIGSAGSVRAARPSAAPHATADPTTFIYGTSVEPDSLNPSIGQLVPSFDVWSGVFDQLILPSKEDTFTPDLATSWNISKDNLTYTFHLRHGVRWADGTPFTAKDVVFTYRQFANPKNNNFSTQGWDHITSAQMPDAYTVIFHTKQVYAPFLATVGAGAWILPARYFEHSRTFLKDGNFNHDPFNRTPFGTGPFRVKEWKSADHITLVRNPYYWGPKPYFKQIIARIVPNDNTLLVQLRTNEIYQAQITQQQVSLATSIPGKALVARPGAAWYHIDLKQWGFLRDQTVRVALDYATPKDEILKTVLHGYGQVAYADIAPVSWAYNPNLPKHPFSLATAAKMLAGDGFTKGSDGILRKGGVPFSMSLWVTSSDAPGAQIMQIVKYEWGQLGIKVEVRNQESSALYGPNGPQFTHQMTGVAYAWYNSNDPDDRYFWNSTQIPPTPSGAGGNDVAYFHKFSFQKQIDDLTNAAVQTVDQTKRKALYAQIQVLLAQQVPVIFIDWEPLLYVAPKNLKGFDPSPWTSLLYNVAQWHY